MELSKYKYVSAIRTRNAELKGLEHLTKLITRKCLPLVEFTQSRRSTKNPDGSIQLSVDKITDILDNLPFIADLTSLRRLQNKDVLTLLSPDNNFENWTTFVKEHLPGHCIPALHLTLPYLARSLRSQASTLAAKHDYVALRIPTGYDGYCDVLDGLGELFGNLDKIVVIIDAGFVQPRGIRGAIARVSEMTQECDDRKPALLATLASGFPSSVVTTGYGEDEHGSFQLTEVTLSEEIRKISKKAEIVHGDYASIHPLDFEGTVTNWVPRVDVPLAKSLYYYRFRRDDGGYERAAKKALHDKQYVDMDCWGCENIKDAARGDPQGRNPAHWIAVRLNIHMSRQIKRLTAK